MSFRHAWEKKLLSAVLSAALLLGAASPALAAKPSIEPNAALATASEIDREKVDKLTADPLQGGATSLPDPSARIVSQPSEAEKRETPNQASPAFAETTTISEPTGSVPLARVGSDGTASKQTFHPSDLSNWIVYDHYYNPSFAWSKNGAPAWDSDAGGGYHPFFYWKENNTTANDNFYNVSTPEGKARMQSEVLGASPCVAHFSQHIYTDESASGSAIRFVGYGETAKTDWAIAPETSRELKSLAFDIDASSVDPHSLEGFGILVNAGIDRATDTLRGYAVNFKVTGGKPGAASGVLQVIDLAGGVSASKLHDGLPGFERLAGVGPVAAMTAFDFQQSPVGKLRVDLDIEPTKLTIKLSYYAGIAQLSAPNTFTVNLKDTGLGGYGPIVNYNGERHCCARMSSVTFACTVMAVNYSVLFDGNGANANPKPERLDGIVPGKSLSDMGMQLPTPPARLGYRFAGWNTAPDGSGQRFDASLPITKITTVYATWTDLVTVSYVSDGWGVLVGNKTVSIKPGQHPGTIPTPSALLGYQFSHWYFAGDPAKTPYTTADLERSIVNTDAEFHAVFVEVGRQHEVQYAAGANGSLQGMASYKGIRAGSRLAKSAPAPSPVPNPGFVFTEWQGARGSRIDVSSANVSDETVRITARFERDENGDGIADILQNRYTLSFTSGAGGKLQGQLTYVLIGGRKGDNKGLTINNVIGGRLVLPKAVPDAGYSFAGWSPEINFLKMQIRGDARITANFRPNLSVPTDDAPFTLRFTSNNIVLKDYKALKGARVSDVTYGYNALPTPTAPSGYKFIGWTCPDGKIRTTAQVLLLYSDSDMTFVATFAKAKPR